MSEINLPTIKILSAAEFPLTLSLSEETQARYPALWMIASQLQEYIHRNQEDLRGFNDEKNVKQRLASKYTSGPLNEENKIPAALMLDANKVVLALEEFRLNMLPAAKAKSGGFMKSDEEIECEDLKALLQEFSSTSVALIKGGYVEKPVQHMRSAARAL